MIKNIFLLLVSLSFATSCAIGNKKSKRYQEVDAEIALDVPKWVYAAQDFCQPGKWLCASAEGQSQEVADLNAKKSLGAIFETKIKSKFEIEQHDYTNAQMEELSQRVYDSVSESVDTVLKGSIIKERFHKNELYFALAAIDKFKASKVLKREIDILDDQLTFLFDAGKKSSILKMHLLFDQREMLSQKHVILTGDEVPTSLSFSKINSLKYQKSQENKIYLKSVNSVPRTLVKWMESLFTEMGFIVSKENDIDYLIRIKYFVKELYLKVEGFKKFSFTIVAEAKNNAGEILGVSTTEQVSTGRNQQDAFLKIKPKLQESFKHELEKLNLD